MKKQDINQQWVDNLKSQPISTQVLEILQLLNSNVDIFSFQPMLIQFSDLLKDIQIANKTVGNNGDFYQTRVDEVMRMRGLK
jgi:hypothetical protein